MPLAYGTETENEAHAASRRTRLIGVRHNAGVKQGRGFERILIQKIGADQLTLGSGKDSMRCESFLHFIRAGLERLQQVTMSTFEIVQDVRELSGNGFWIERENPVDDMICAHFVGRVQVARFSRRLERPHYHPRGIGTQVKCLPVQEGGL
jgi:hypothetical protein